MLKRDATKLNVTLAGGMEEEPEVWQPLNGKEDYNSLPYIAFTSGRVGDETRRLDSRMIFAKDLAAKIMAENFNEDEESENQVLLKLKEIWKNLKTAIMKEIVDEKTKPSRGPMDRLTRSELSDLTLSSSYGLIPTAIQPLNEDLEEK